VRVHSESDQVSGDLTMTRFPFTYRLKHKYSKGFREWRVRPLYSLKLKINLTKTK